MKPKRREGKQQYVRSGQRESGAAWLPGDKPRQTDGLEKS